MAEKVKKESRIKKFFKDYKSEFKKITWPDKKDTFRMSGVVILAIVIFGAVEYLLDGAFLKLIQLLAGL